MVSESMRVNWGRKRASKRMTGRKGMCSLMTNVQY
uniref:Uncharacterized protein n=1 Tax=Anguilla anguilla TaxID=7936 RepID=A0A0E9QSK0_ANGAN